MLDEKALDRSVRNFKSWRVDSILFYIFQVLFSAAFALLELPSQNFSLRTHDGLIDNNGASLTELNLTGDVLISVEMLD